MALSDSHARGHPAAPDGMFEIETVRVGEDLFLLVSGELDLGSAGKLAGAIRVAENRMAREVIVDLRDLRSMDSAGLNVLMKAHTRSEQNGQWLRYMPSKYDAVMQLVAVAGASRMFN